MRALTATPTATHITTLTATPTATLTATPTATLTATLTATHVTTLTATLTTPLTPPYPPRVILREQLKSIQNQLGYEDKDSLHPAVRKLVDRLEERRGALSAEAAKVRRGRDMGGCEIWGGMHGCCARGRGMQR